MLPVFQSVTCPLSLWHCWFGHLARKIVPEKIYNVSSRKLNPTIPYLSSSVTESNGFTLVTPKLELQNELALDLGFFSSSVSSVSVRRS